MKFEEALEAKIALLEEEFANLTDRSFDAWDKAKLDYLQAARERLRHGETPEKEYDRAVAELPQLQEEVAREEALPTFDWYDDHHYEKIACGRESACQILIQLYEEVAKRSSPS